MTTTSRHDAWQTGDSYEQYMGRWSRMIAPRFLDWLGMPAGLDWLEVGCGTGALSAAIVSRCEPKSLVSIDPSESFLAKARGNVPEERVSFQLGDAQALPANSASKDVIASALMLNFVADRQRALAEMIRVARPGGTIGFYVWDYPGGGVQFMCAFWQAATDLDSSAADLNEDRRFPFCTPDGLRAMAKSAGLEADVAAIEVPTVFRDFDDYWRPFTLGAGPAPGYCTSLAADAQHRLRDRLRQSLPTREDGTIPLEARAWAVRAILD